jgi:plasmid maintenance system antidote protein VapI
MNDSRHELLDDYLTKTQLAEELHRHPRTIDRWVRLRAGPPETVIGRQRLYKRTSVEKWLADLEDRAA